MWLGLPAVYQNPIPSSRAPRDTTGLRCPCHSGSLVTCLCKWKVRSSTCHFWGKAFRSQRVYPMLLFPFHKVSPVRSAEPQGRGWAPGSLHEDSHPLNKAWTKRCLLLDCGFIEDWDQAFFILTALSQGTTPSEWQVPSINATEILKKAISSVQRKLRKGMSKGSPYGYGVSDLQGMGGV